MLREQGDEPSMSVNQGRKLAGALLANWAMDEGLANFYLINLILELVTNINSYLNMIKLCKH